MNPNLQQSEIILTKDSSPEDRKIVYDRIRALRGKIHWSLKGDWTKSSKKTKKDSP
jgi:hypothetical protein